MPNVTYDCTWRCMCGHENHPTFVWCFACNKRRWKQLGWSHYKVLDTLSLILSDYLFEKVQA